MSHLFETCFYLESINCTIAAVTLEGEVVLGRGRIQILDCYSPLNTAQSEAGGLRCLLVSEDGDTAVLVLEWRLYLLVFFGLTPVQLVDDDAASCCAHHCHGEVNISTVSSLWQVNVEDGSGSSAGMNIKINDNMMMSYLVSQNLMVLSQEQVIRAV